MNTKLRNRLIVFTLVLVVAVLFLLPTVLRGSLPSSWISKPISLGLDLSGGVHLVYTVKAREAVNSRLQAIGSLIRSDLRKKKVAVTRVVVGDEGNLELTLLSPRLLESAKEAIQDGYKELNLVSEDSESARPKLVYAFSPQHIKDIENSAIGQAVETLRNRVDQFGVAEPVIQKIGVDRILLQMPGISDIESVKKVVGSVAKLEFHLLPLPSSKSYTKKLKDRSGVPVEVEEEALMTGDAIDNASVAFSNGLVEVSLKFTSEGARLFSKITAENVHRNMAIILDGVVYSSPEIKERISGGMASISGGFTVEEARQLAVVLRAGALPAPLEIIEERTVGPTLGRESIQNGINAMLIGFALIIVFMLFYYKKAGAVAIGTLILNLVLILGALSAFGATLTLPGLAGLALTVGMAVDANVIIFERIREELRNGAGRDASVEAGFGKALSAIIDSNVTTLLAGLILYYFGTGPIRGFAVTLSIGILTTIYCATFVARLAFDFWELKGGQQRLSI